MSAKRAVVILAIALLVGWSCSDKKRRDDASVVTPPPPPPVSIDATPRVEAAPAPAIDPMVQQAMTNRGGGMEGAVTTGPSGSAQQGSASVPAKDDIDMAVEAAIARKRASLAGPVKDADANDQSAQKAIAESDRGTKKQRDVAVETMKNAWMGGHSPQGNAIFDGEATAELRLRDRVAKARALPTEQQGPAAKKAIDEFPADAEQAIDESKETTAENQMMGLLKAAAPLAAFAGCLALGGGPVCGAVAAFIAKVFGVSPGSKYSKQLGGILSDAQDVLNGTCDFECLLGLVGGGDKVPPGSAIDELFKGLGEAGRDYSKWRDKVKDAVGSLPGIRACVEDIGTNLNNIGTSQACKTVLGPDPSLHLSKLEKCVKVDKRRRAVCFKASVAVQ